MRTLVASVSGSLHVSLALLALLALLAGCGGSTSASVTTGPSSTEQSPAGHSGAEAPAAVEAPALAGAELPNPCDGGTVQLHEGQGEYPSSIGLDEPGGIEVQEVGAHDLDHDGELEHLAYVLCMPGGSGTFDSVRAYHFREGRFVEAAVIEGGDRADGGLDVPRVEGDAVVVGRFSGDEDGVCCPTHVTDETWRLQDGSFVRTAQGERRPYVAD